MFSNVSFLIPQNNSNPALNGLYWEIDKTMFKMTSTDGHCLVQATSTKYNLEESKNWLLPRRAIFEVKKILECSQDKMIFIGTCGNQLVFSGDSFNFFTKLLVEPFPQYSAILEKDGFYGATVDRESFVKTLRRSACLLSGQFIATKLGFEKDLLHVSMQNKEVGKLDEEIQLLSFDGEKMDIRFYAPYLVNGLQVFGQENIEFFLKNSSRPIVFESNKDDKSLTYLVMPVSATNN
jgi:DNA polymerase sliding clamp subunit (PCNA homolog)